MAILGNDGRVTLADWAQSLDPEGNTAAVVELLNQTNEVLTDAVWLEGNLATGHQSTVRTDLPSAVWRKLYRGVPASKSGRGKVTDTCGMLETRAEIDKDVIELNGNTNEFRLSEGYSFIEAMNQEMASTLFYGNTDTHPERYMGLAPRYNTLNPLERISQNILDGGGVGADNTSVYLVGWGNNTVHGIFPKGAKAGLQHEDLGLGDAFDEDGNRYRAWMDHWQWKCGLTVRDWRYVARIANIDTSELVAESNAAADLIKLMIKAMHRIPSLGMCRPVFYVSRTVRQQLDIQALNSSNGVLKITEAAGQFKTDFFGIPIRTVDAILDTEDLVTA